jgi:hypothetical protein
MDDFLDRADKGVNLETLDQTTDSRCGLLVLKAGGLIRMRQAQMIAQQAENHAARRSRFALLLGQSAKAGMAFPVLDKNLDEPSQGEHSGDVLVTPGQIGGGKTNGIRIRRRNAAPRRSVFSDAL